MKRNTLLVIGYNLLFWGGGGERVIGLVDLAKDSKHTVILVSNRTMSVNFLFWLNIL